MLNCTILSQHSLICSRNNFSVTVVEHPGWYQIFRNYNNKISHKSYLPFKGLKDRTIQEEVQYQIKTYIKKQINHGYVVHTQ